MPDLTFETPPDEGLDQLVGTQDDRPCDGDGYGSKSAFRVLSG